MLREQSPGTKRSSAFCGVDRQTLHALEPLPVPAQQGDDGYWHMENAAQLHAKRLLDLLVEGNQGQDAKKL